MISSKKFLPENLQDQELFQKFTTLLDQVIQKEDELIKPLLNKLDPEISKEDIEDIYKEFGFDYITDLLSVEETSEILAIYFSLIRAYKGKRSGLELFFQLLGWKYEIKEWWEYDPPKTPYTANINVVFNIGDLNYNPDRTPVGKLLYFIRNYVYPLVHFTITFLLQPLNYGIASAGTTNRRFEALRIDQLALILNASSSKVTYLSVLEG